MRGFLVSGVLAFAVGLATPALAQDEELSAADRGAIDALVLPVLKSLQGDSSANAIQAFLGTGKTGVIGPVQVGSVVAQVTTALSSYGKVTHCSLIDEQEKATLVVVRTYLCQHQKFVTRWHFTLVKLPDGWSAAGLSFDDKIDEIF